MYANIFKSLIKIGCLPIAVSMCAVFLAIRLACGTPINDDFTVILSPPQNNVSCSGAEPLRALMNSNCVVLTQKITGLNGSMADISRGLQIGFRGQKEVSERINSRLGELRNNACSIRENNEKLAVRFDVETKRFRNELQTMEQMVLLLGLIVIFLAAGGYFLLFHLIRRISFSKTPINRLSVTQTRPEITKSTVCAITPELKKNMEDISPIESITPSVCHEPPKIPSPAQCLDEIIDFYNFRGNLVLKPSIISGYWLSGYVTLQGHVREENEDYVLVFSMGKTVVSITADGCGGVQNGKYASYFAVKAAAISLIEALAANPEAADFLSIVRQAIVDGSCAIAKQAAQYGLEGLRTTLVVLLATDKVNTKREGYFCAYLGDGGGVIVRADDKIESFLIPQKAAEMAPNILAASLGPEIQGEIQSWAGEVRPGDTVIICSDGMADRMPADFPVYIAQLCRKDTNNLQKVVETLASRFVDHRDNEGFVADDNLSLTVIMPKDKGVG